MACKKFRFVKTLSLSLPLPPIRKLKCQRTKQIWFWHLTNEVRICWLWPWICWYFFVEMPQLNTTSLAPIMQSCPSAKILPAIMLVLLTAFTNQRVFLKTGSPYFRDWPFTGSLMIHYWYIWNLLTNLTHLQPNLDKDSVFRGHKMHPRVFQEPLCENA